MSTYDRFKKALRANLNDLMERAARGEDVRASVRRFEEHAMATRAELRDARRHLTELEDDARRAQYEGTELERRAMAALQSGDEAAARALLSEKMDVEREARRLSDVVASERHSIRELEEVIADLEAKVTPAIEWARKSREEKERAEAEARAEKLRRKERPAKEKKDSEKKDGEKKGEGAPERPRDQFEEEAWRELERDLGEDVPSSGGPARTGPGPDDELKNLKDKLKGDDDKPKK